VPEFFVSTSALDKLERSYSQLPVSPITHTHILLHPPPQPQPPTPNPQPPHPTPNPTPPPPQGNVVDPRAVIEGGKDQKKDPPYGADVLRLWVSSVDYSNDVMVGDRGA